MEDLSIFLLEDKDVGNIKFDSYECVCIVKVIRKYNKTDILDRIRGIKNVTKANVILSDKISKRNKKGSKYEYVIVRIKFITDQDPKDELEDIQFGMVKHDDDHPNIVGLVSAKFKEDTLIKK